MALSLIPLLSVDRAARQATEVGIPAELAALNVFRVLLHRPAVAKAISDLLLSMLFGGALDDRHRELVIMRIGWATGADYEWTQHWAIAQERFGCDREDLLGIRDWEGEDRYTASERAALVATDETLTAGRISPATMARCRELLESDEAVVELVVAIGAWRTISEITRSLEIPLEEGVASWPPDGVAGAAADSGRPA